MTLAADPDWQQHRAELLAAFYPAKPKEPKPKKRSGKTTTEMVEDLEWLIQQGECVASICTQYELTADALERRLHRHGRHDLAAYFRSYTR